MSIIRRALGRVLTSQKTFELFQKFGLHLVPNHFYSPIPDTRDLGARAALWDRESPLAGVDMNEGRQLEMLELFQRFQAECNFPLERTDNPDEYFIRNGGFGFMSAAVLHAMVRHFTPARIIEVGSGFSTRVSARALRSNHDDGHPGELTAIEPYPSEALRSGFDGLSRLVTQKVEDVDLEFFDVLEEGDILFIDSSHVVRTGGDVNYLYLEVLPRLNKGVVIHIHDIFFPLEYPKDWVIGNRRFWTEQYGLQMFLAFNSAFRVLWCGSLMYLRHREALARIFPPPAGLGAGKDYFSSSFWMQKQG
jgi:predicted O-methyltransferase YrrM